MHNTINQYVQTLNRRHFTKNVQRVLYSLLTAENNLVSRGSLRVPAATAYLRDLRKNKYGAFNIVCRTSEELNRTGTRTTWYELDTSNLSLAQVRRVFEGV